MKPLKEKGETPRPKLFMGRGRRSSQEIKSNLLPSRPSSPSRDENQNPFRPLTVFDDELDGVAPPPTDDAEFPQVPSPPPLSDINLTETGYDIESRNDKVSLWKLSSQINSNAPDCSTSTSKEKLNLCTDTRKSCSDEDSSTSCSASSYCSNPNHIDEERCIPAIVKILEDEQAYRHEIWSKLPISIAGENKDKMKIPLVGLPFCYFTFQKYLQAKWTVVKLRRMENILNGEYSLEKIQEDLLDMELQFEKVYGPMDRTSQVYKDLLLQFKADRLKVMINMMEKENHLLCEIIDGKLSQDARKKLGQRYANARMELEEWLKALCEAYIGVNPYTSPLRMDFFVLPRPPHTLDCYDLTASEVKNFVEFQKPNKTTCAEGYNPAVLDVGLMNPNLIVGKFGVRVCGQSILVKEEKSELRTARQILKRSKNNVCRLDMMIKQYPLGIEEKVFFTKFRISETLFDDENVFDGYSDRDGIRAFPDSFFPQSLGKDGRVILFPGVLEGQIITPEEILRKVWKRIRFLLESGQKPVLNLGQLCSTYEQVFKQPIYPLQWGFQNVTDFAEYSLQLLGDEVEDISLIENHQVEGFLKEVYSEEEKEEEIEEEFPESLRCAWETLSKQEWFPLEEPLDADSVFEIHESSDSLWDSRFFEMN